MNQLTAIEILRRLINLTDHPYFPLVRDLPAWQELLAEARKVTGDGQ